MWRHYWDFGVFEIKQRLPNNGFFVCIKVQNKSLQEKKLTFFLTVFFQEWFFGKVKIN